MENLKTITLPSGVVATERRASHRQLRLATKIAENDKTLMLNALISARFLFDGKEVLPEDVDDMDMRDTIILSKEVGDFLDVGVSAL